MDYYTDTSIYTSNPVVWEYVAPFEPEKRQRQRSVVAKEVQTSVAGAPDFFSSASGPAAPTAYPSRRPGIEVAQPMTTFAAKAREIAQTQPNFVQQSEVEHIAKQRVRLMAAKYASGSESEEMLARFEILNRRLLEKAPRIRAEHAQALESAAAQLAQVRQSREDRMKRLGIRA